MRKVALAGIATAALALTACGGSSGSSLSSGTPQDQIRAVETQGISAMLSSDPASVCKLTTYPGKCMTAMLEAKAMGIKVADMVPADWRNRVANATVTVSGDTATMSPIVGQQSSKFVRQDGHWLMAESKGS